MRVVESMENKLHLVKLDLNGNNQKPSFVNHLGPVVEKPVS